MCCLLCAILAAVAVRLDAQTTTGTLSGTIVDPSGRVVAGARITVTDAASTHEVSAFSDAAGRYSITLGPGSYEVRVTAPGFDEHRAQATLIANQNTVADVALAIAAFAERTTATAAAPAARSDVSLESTALPTPVTAISHDELQRTNIAQDVGTIFRRVPGVLAHNINQGETGTAIKMRGFSSSTHGADTAAYVDGISQNVPSSAINHGMNDMSWLTPDMVERIEVIKGPFSALYGDQNRAGAVNIVTRSVARPSAALTLGSFGNKRLSGVYARPVGAAQVLLAGEYFDINGYRDNNSDTRGSIFAKVSLTRGNGAWSARAMYYKADWDAPGFLNVDAVDRGLVQPTDRDPTAPPLWGKGNRLNVVLTRTPAHGDEGLHVAVAFENYDRTRALGANLTDYNVQSDDRWFGQARAVENLVAGSRAAVAIGGEYRHDRGDSINRRWPSGTPGPNYSWNQDLDLSSYAALVQGQLKAASMLKLIGGTRYDWFDYDIVNRKLPAASVHYAKGVATPRGGVVFTPIKWLELFTNVGQGFRSPNQSEISPSGAVGPLGAPGGAPFGNLAVPKVRSYDFGATAAMNELWTVTVARYHTFNENEIIQVTPGVFDSVGDTVRNGFDIEAKITPSATTSIYGSLAEITEAKINNPPANSASLFLVPRHMVKAGLAQTLRTPAGAVLLNLDGYYMSGIPYFTGTPLLQSGVSRPYSRFDARGTFERGSVQYTGYATFQPRELSSEPLSVTAAGVFYDPRPKAEFGLTLRYGR